jgi:hypothetical protein
MKNKLIEDMELSVRAYHNVKQINIKLERNGFPPIIDTDNLSKYTEKELRLLFIDYPFTLKELAGIYDGFPLSYKNIRKDAGIS